MNDEVKKAFDAWCASGNPRYHPTDDAISNRRDWKVWQAATARERERCARLCETLGMATNGIYERNHEMAVAIRQERIQE